MTLSPGLFKNLKAQPQKISDAIKNFERNTNSINKSGQSNDYDIPTLKNVMMPPLPVDGFKDSPTFRIPPPPLPGSQSSMGTWEKRSVVENQEQKNAY